MNLSIQKYKNKTCEMHFCKKVKIAEIFSGNIHFSKIRYEILGTGLVGAEARERSAPTGWNIMFNFTHYLSERTLNQY